MFSVGNVRVVVGGGVVDVTFVVVDLKVIIGVVFCLFVCCFLGVFFFCFVMVVVVLTAVVSGRYYSFISLVFCYDVSLLLLSTF